MRRIAAPALLIACLLATGSAHAVYVVTDLRVFTETPSANVGDTVRFEIAAENETSAKRWAGADVVVRYSYDPAESADGDAPVLDENASAPQGGRVGAVRLDAAAAGAFDWTVPAEVDDHNVAILVESSEGELLASAHLAVGDAPAVMYASGGPGAQLEEPIAAEDGGPADETRAPSDEPARTPAPGIAAGLALLAVAALARSRRRA